MLDPISPAAHLPLDPNRFTALITARQAPGTLGTLGPQATRETVRANAAVRSFPKADLPKVRRTAFVAAGFLIGHASMLDAVPFDPYFPFCFMGEELALSLR